MKKFIPIFLFSAFLILLAYATFTKADDISLANPIQGLTQAQLKTPAFYSMFADTQTEQDKYTFLYGKLEYISDQLNQLKNQCGGIK